MLVGVLALLFVSTLAQCNINDNNRLDCYPESGSTQSACEARGCCWAQSGTSGVPWCFYPTTWGYAVESQKSTPTGITASLTRVGPPSPYGGDINTLQLDVLLETDTRLHFKITDPANARYEVPISTPQVSTATSNPAYSYSIATNPFALQVRRVSTGSTIFDSSLGGMIFSDQFIQLSTTLASNVIMGLGEHVSQFLLTNSWQTTLTLWARDQGTPTGQSNNLYGAHPFYVCLENDGNAYGVFLLNSNAMDVVLQPTPALTYRTIGGILDFYVFLGPTVDQVVSQLVATVGRPFMPPYWALGFHLCRWGYDSLNETKKINDQMRAAGVPQDVQWNDIDYMRSYLDFTYDPVAYNGLPQFVDSLHSLGQRYVVITDPGISNTQAAGSYQPYTDGVSADIFIKGYNNKLWSGQVWPGQCYFPDFTHPSTPAYWQTQISAFHSQVGFDGLWIDMNEIATIGSSDDCGNDKYTSPPYQPHVLGTLSEKTLCSDALQYGGQVHYNIHSLYGYKEMVSTMGALTNVLNRRSLVISRSTFTGAGMYGGHWLGDNTATWNDLYYSIPGILSFQLFGVPLVGADICGFNGDTTEELCARWMQLGAFYPFSRNHNTIGAADQDPVSMGPLVTNVSIAALNWRYTLLPYLYTLFHHAAHTGTSTTVARALLFEFPTDKATYSIDQQFMWGSGLLISPVLQQGAVSVNAYFPAARWFALQSGGAQVSGSGGSNGVQVTVSAPLNSSGLPLHVRGGYILPTQQPNITTAYSRQQPYGVLVALDNQGKAAGDLYIDDGESLTSYTSGAYTYIQFTASASPNTIAANVVVGGYTPPSSARLSTVTVYGLLAPVSQVSVGSSSTPFSYDPVNKALYVTGLSLDMTKPWQLTWS